MDRQDITKKKVIGLKNKIHLTVERGRYKHYSHASEILGKSDLPQLEKMIVFFSELESLGL